MAHLSSMPARNFTLICAAALALFGARPAAANDSTAELGAGGLQLVRTDAIALLAEDLFISADEIRVTYRFRNQTEAPVTYLVAFPLPAIDAVVPEAMNVAMPSADANFVGFTVSVDGETIAPSVEERVTAMGVDRTEEVRRLGLPLNPIAEGLYQRLQTLPADITAELNRLGLVYVDPYNVEAAWRLETTFYWEQTFPPGQTIVVEHRYKPVVGYGFFGDYVLSDAGYKEKYCIDSGFDRAARRKLSGVGGTDFPYLNEKRLSYILTTANNWSGPIGDFRLTVDKGSPDALVSFCGTDVTKVSPTRFEMRATDFVPEAELDILIATPQPPQ
ncbi:DUF4424 domain-containing protein [Bauldia litoralis]|uniref:DUF4424 domain-containing protein n=1 Tax=Bauldia litoralis TaxID=665467 RepID=A0A1G6AI21_9HYPH|nr:DUF4424 domain-containing protein [Bauldia litoralis]SDB08061.1 protein of unknown function [Bauldia litoralis]